jgi:uncharacterized protein YndB with AHSA1/START domain
MNNRTFHFRAHLLVPFPTEMVYNYLSDPNTYPIWWGSVVRSCKKVEASSEQADFPAYKMSVRGLLLFPLQLKQHIKELNPAEKIEFITSGDLAGGGKWLLEEREGKTQLTFEWHVQPQKKFLQWISPFFKPIFRMHHRYCLRKAGEGLRKQAIKELNRLPVNSIPLF